MRSTPAWLITLAVLALSILAAVTIGSTDIPISDVYHVIFYKLFGAGDSAWGEGNLFRAVWYAVRGGEVVGQGTPRELLTPEFIREVYEVDAQVMTGTDGALCPTIEKLREMLHARGIETVLGTH